MRIKYTGFSQIREVGPYSWTREPDGRVQEVDDPKVVSELMGHEGFEIADDEPLLQIASREQAELMGMFGIAALSTLVELPAAKVKELAELLSVVESDVKQWVKAAKALLVTLAQETAPIEDNTMPAQEAVS